MADSPGARGRTFAGPPSVKKPRPAVSAYDHSHDHGNSDAGTDSSDEGVPASAAPAPVPGDYTDADFLRDNPDFVLMPNDGVFCVRWCTEQDGVRFSSHARGHVNLSSLCGEVPTKALLDSKAPRLFPEAVTLEAYGSNIMKFAPVMHKFAHIRSLSIQCLQTDNIVEILEALKPLRLKTLFISGGGAAGLVSGEILKHVNFEQLTELSLWDMTLSRPAVMHISKQPLLETLHLINCGLIDSDIHLLKRLDALKSLSLGSNNITGPELNKLLKDLHPSLIYFDVDCSPDDEDMCVRRLVERRAPQPVEGARALFS